MDLRGVGAVEKFHRFSQLGAADNGIVHKQQLFAFDQFRYGNLLHLGHLITDVLVGWHKGTGPGRRVFYKRTGKGFSTLGGITDGMGNSRVRDAGHVIHVRQGAGGRAMISPLR